MIRDYKTFNLFPIPIGRVVTAMPNDEITKFTCEFLTENELGYTTFHNPDKNKIYQRDMPSSSKFVEMIFQHHAVLYMSLEQGIRDHLPAKRLLFPKAT